MEPQNRRELNFRVNASPAADAHSGWCATALPTLQHPQSAPSESSHHLPDPSQPHDYTGVVWDDRVRDWRRDVLSFTGDSFACSVSRFQQWMLLVIVAKTRPGRICPHPSKVPLLWVNHKPRGTMTWPITTWPTIILRHTGIAIMMSPTMLDLLKILPKRQSTNQPMCVLPSLPIQISNQTLHQRISTHSTTQGSTLQLALLEPSSMNGLTRTSFLMD
jgi:hypothetical protein